jgi:hypothetical protein
MMMTADPKKDWSNPDFEMIDTKTETKLGVTSPAVDVTDFS